MASDYLFLFRHVCRGNYSGRVLKYVTASLTPLPCPNPFTLQGGAAATYSAPGASSTASTCSGNSLNDKELPSRQLFTVS